MQSGRPVPGPAGNGLGRYGWALVSCLLASLLTAAIPGLNENSPFLMFFGAVVASAWLWGTGPGLLSVGTSLLVTTAFVTHYFSRALHPTDYARLATFAIISVLVVELARRRRIAEQRDIAERSRAADSFRALVQLAPDAIVGVNPAGQIQLVNSQAESMFGYTLPELLGAPIEMLIPEPLRHSHLGYRLKYEANPHVRLMGARGMPLSARRKDGAVFPVEISLSPIQTEQGLLITSIIRDITERRRAEAQREELIREQAARMEAQTAKQRYYDLVQNLEAIVWELDLETRRLTFVSKRAAELLGYPTEHWLNSPDAWIEHVHPEDREEFRRFLNKASEGGPANIEYRALAGDGRKLWLRLIVDVTRDSGNRPRSLRGLTVDITERRQTEDALRLSEKLAATGRLAATIAHEINNPMGAVLNLLYLIETQPELTPESRRYARMGQQEMERMAHITRQMLGFYRDSTAPVPVNVPEILDGTLELYDRRIRENNIRVDRRFATVATILAFPGEMRQVFSNLLVNAVEAVGQDGHVRIKVSRSRDWNTQRPGIRITFADNGSGISPEHRQHIFEPFFTTKGEKGTGLGLWVSYGIVRKHNGTVRVRSSIQQGRTGTAFSIFLPETGIPAPSASSLKTKAARRAQ